MSNYEKISTINMTHEDWLKERRHIEAEATVNEETGEVIEVSKQAVQ